MRRNTSKIITTITIALVLVVAFTISSVVSYGGTPKAENVIAAENLPADAGTDSTPVWKDMNHKQRQEYMRKTVMPKMKPEFIAMDAKRFGRMNCMTCHGDGAKDDSFKMPNPKLPKLPTTSEGFQKLKEKFPDMMNFMSTKVKPDMASLLGMPMMSQQNPKGFSCMSCHTSE